VSQRPKSRDRMIRDSDVVDSRRAVVDFTMRLEPLPSETADTCQVLSYRRSASRAVIWSAVASRVRWSPSAGDGIGGRSFGGDDRLCGTRCGICVRLSGVDVLLARVSRVLWWTEELRNALVCVVRANLLRRGRASCFRRWRMIATASRTGVGH